MKVSIVNYTKDPMKTISFSAGVCYAKRDASDTRVKACYGAEHMSVFEHACVTFMVEDISRACSHQLVRHRMASYCQRSQRYVKGAPDSVVPPRIESLERAVDVFTEADCACAKAYKELIDMGIPAEDARYILPNASETTICVTMNWRELFHFWNLRTDKRAQWEIRELAWKMVEACREQEDLAPLVKLWDGDAE